MNLWWKLLQKKLRVSSFNLQFIVLILCKIPKTTKYSVVIYIYKFNVLLHCQKYAAYNFSLHFLFWKRWFLYLKKPKKYNLKKPPRCFWLFDMKCSAWEPTKEGGGRDKSRHQKEEDKVATSGSAEHSQYPFQGTESSQGSLNLHSQKCQCLAVLNFYYPAMEFLD